MVLAHNLTAMNAQRQFNIVGTAKKKSTEKLSSGYKINRAADDAAGLSISEKMRKQIRGLDRASDNCQDGVSLCQVADGALAETQDMLQRLTELSVQAANGTLSSSDRDAIQKEVNQIKDEINRVARTTKFNEIFPLNKLTNTNVQSTESDNDIPIGWKIPDSVVEESFVACNRRTRNENGEIIYIGDKTGVWPTVNGKPLVGSDTAVVTGLYVENTAGTHCILVDDGWHINLNACVNGLFSLTDEKLVDLRRSQLRIDEVDGRIYYNSPVTGRKEYLHVNGNGLGILGGESDYFYAEKEDDFYNETIANTEKDIDDISIHAGADSDMTNKIGLHTVDASANALGISNLNLTTEESATNAIDEVGKALQVVSDYRSYFGAVQNRMEHTIANLDNVVENTQAAESRIRDTDMAKEMVNNTKLNILEQAVTSMMTQANQSTQGVLSLLQ